MTQRYSVFFFLLLGWLAVAGWVPATAQCVPGLTEDVEGVSSRDDLVDRGWQFFGVSTSTAAPLSGTRSFRTSGTAGFTEGGDPNDPRTIQTPHLTVDGDVCVEFIYADDNANPSTEMIVRLVSPTGDAVEVARIANPAETPQTFRQTIPAASLPDGFEVVRVSIVYVGPTAPYRLQVDDLALSIDERYPGGVNRPPDAVDDAYNARIRQTVAQNVLDNDTDPDVVAGIDDGPLTVTLDTGVSNGTLQLNADGTFEYTPTSDGADSFTYEVCDDGFDPKCATATVTFDVALPVELGRITATPTTGRVIVEWTTLSEVNNDGFRVLHRPDVETESFQDVGFVAGQGTTFEPSQYRFAVSGLQPGTHLFRLEQLDVDGTPTLSHVVSATVELSSGLSLQPAGPNPFRTRTTLRFAVDTAEQVDIHLFDLLGRRVETLYSDTPTPGRYHTVTIDAADLAPGRYLVRARSATSQTTLPITVVR